MAEGGRTPAKSPAKPTLKELSNALDSVVNWHLLGVKLGLEDHELLTIEQNHRGDDSERCKHEVLSCWLRNAKLPTWKAVTDALHLMREHTVALKIQAKYCTDTDMAALTRQSMSTVGASEVPSSDNSSAIVGPQVFLHMADSLVLTKENIQMIKGKFASLLALAKRVLQGKNVGSSKFRRCLATCYLPEEDSNDAKEINASRFIAEVLGNAQSLGEIFELLKIQGLLSYKNFYVLRFVINKYASDDAEMKKKLSEYEEELAGFFLVVKMKDYLDAELQLQQGEQSKPDPKLLDELSVKLKAKVTEKTLKYVSELWDSLAYQVKMPVTALPFHRVAKACVEITWLVPFHLTHFATRRLQESTDYFRLKNIFRVTIAERCVYEELPPVQEIARMVEADPGQMEDRDDPDAGNQNPLQRSEQLIDEGPEAIPEHEQSMKCARVIRTNYSLLYGHLESRGFLQKLPEKDLIDDTQSKAADSYQQRFAKNAVVINALLQFDRPSHGLLKFCDTLETTPGQEHVARKLLKDYKQTSPSYANTRSPIIGVPSDVSETSQMFQQLQRKVMDLLDQFPNALSKLKQVLGSLVLPLGEGKVAPLVDPLAYEDAKTVRELFRLMASYWNPLSADLLGLLMEASGCKQAASKVAEFVEARANKGHLVLCIRQLPTLASGENDLNVADLEMVHNAPLSELQSLHPAVFARLPEHKSISARTTVRISVEVNKPLVCIADYEEITTALSSFFLVPKAALVYAGCSRAPVVLCWLAQHDFVAYIRATGVGGLSGHRLLAEHKVTRVAVGDRTYKCPTIKEVELQEASQYGLVGQVHRLLTTGVNLNFTMFDGSTALETASFIGYHKVVELLLGAGANPDLQDKNGFFPLYAASEMGRDEIIEMLVQAGAVVNLQSKDGWTALKVASNNGHHKVVGCLLGAGANPDLQDKNGWTALKAASFHDYHKVVELLLGTGANPDIQSKDGWTSLNSASYKGNHKVVELLLGAGANPDLQDKDGWTALNRASYKGNHKVVELLLGAGANPDLQDKDGETALMRATADGHHKVVELLLGAGAKPDLQNQEKFFPLYYASENGHYEIVEVLLQAGATVDLRSKDGATPLCVACERGLLPVVERLIAAKADVNHQAKFRNGARTVEPLRKGHFGEMAYVPCREVVPISENGATPLMAASFCAYASVVRVLLQSGATINTTTSQILPLPECQGLEGTALHFAVFQEHEDIVEQLLEANADPDLPKKESQETALMMAAKIGNVGIVRKLIHHGANVNLTNKAGNTAYDLASFEGHTDVCQELLTKQSS